VLADLQELLVPPFRQTKSEDLSVVSDLPDSQQGGVELMDPVFEDP
jgi:hypothetical protein